MQKLTFKAAMFNNESGEYYQKDINGYEAIISGHQFVVHKDKHNKWIISEYLTGRKIFSRGEKNRQKAIDKCIEILNKQGNDRFIAALAKCKHIN